MVDMATITNEAIDKMLDNAKNEMFELSDKGDKKEVIKVFDTLEQDTRYDMIANVLNTQNYIVTPKEVDNLIESVADIISSGINLAV